MAVIGSVSERPIANSSRRSLHALLSRRPEARACGSGVPVSPAVDRRRGQGPSGERGKGPSWLGNASRRSSRQQSAAEHVSRQHGKTVRYTRRRRVLARVARGSLVSAMKGGAVQTLASWGAICLIPADLAAPRRGEGPYSIASGHVENVIQAKCIPEGHTSSGGRRARGGSTLSVISNDPPLFGGRSPVEVRGCGGRQDRPIRPVQRPDAALGGDSTRSEPRLA